MQYGGHGVQDNLTYALCNTANREKMFFNLEERVRGLANCDNSYIVGLFDCCRENMDVKGERVKSTIEGRGESVWAGEDVKETEEAETQSKVRNLIMVFGCPPNSQTPANSALTVEFFKHLRMSSDPVEKIAHLPGALPGWRPC